MLADVEPTRRREIARAFNLEFLRMAGYSAGEIAGLGDLSELGAERIQDLIRRKHLEVMAGLFKKMGLRVKRVGGSHRRRRR